MDHGAWRGRPIVFPDDVWLVRDFLAELYALAPSPAVWDVRRWEGSVFYSETPGLAPERAARSRLWVAEDGRIVAAALSEGGRQIHPHVHPETPELLETVVAWAEAAGGQDVLLDVWDGDDPLRRIAVERGYRETDGWEIQLSMRPSPTPAPVLDARYTMRPTRDDAADEQAIADLLNASFGRTFHVAGEHAGLARHASCFRRETDLVAAAADGTLAAYAAVCWDWRNRRATFEPVCTHPGHRQRGLARALMLEGMRRATALGAATIDVGTGDADPANALYASLPFTDVVRGRLWLRGDLAAAEQPVDLVAQ